MKFLVTRRALLEESHCQPQDLIPILGDPAALQAILDHQHPISPTQAQQLAQLFNIEAAYFLLD